MRRLDAAEARAGLGDWLGVHSRCFCPPPWNEPTRSLTGYRERVGWHLEQPGFRAFEIRGADGTVTAVAYGWPSAETLPDRPVYRTVADALGPERLRWLWGARPFEVVELMVDPDARGRGLARQLLAELCPADGVSWLVTRGDTPAAAVYRRLGWQQLGSDTTETGVQLDVFVLDPGPPLS